MKLSCSRIVVEFTLQSLSYIEYGMDVARMVKDRIFYERGAATMWTITPLHLYTMGLPVSGGKSDLICYCVLDGDTFRVYVIAEGVKDLAERACNALRQVMIAAKQITPGAKIGLIAKNTGKSGDDDLFDCAFFIDGFLTASGVRERGQDKRSGFYVRIAPNCASVLMANVDTPVNYEPIWQPGVSVDTTVRAIAAFANWSSGTSSVKFPTMMKTREWVDVDGGWVYEESGIAFFMMWSDGTEFRVVVQNMTTKVQSDFSIYVAGRKPGSREQLMVARENIERLAKVTTKASDTPIPTLFAPFYIVARDIYSGVRLFAVAPDLVISGEIAKTLMRQGPGLKDIRILPFADLSDRQREGNWENEPAAIPRGTTGSSESGWLLVDHPIPNTYITSGWVYTGQNHDAWMKLAEKAKIALPEQVKVGLDEFESFYLATMRSWIMSAEAVDHDALAQKAHQTSASPEQVAAVIVRVDKRKIAPIMKKQIESACRDLWSRNAKANPIMNPAASMGGMVISFKQSEPFITLIQSLGQIDQLCNTDHALKVIFDSNGKFVIPFPSEDGRAPFAMMDAIYDTIARVVDGKTSVDIDAPGITRFFDGEFSDLLIDAALAINGWTSEAFMYADEMETNAGKMDHLVLHQNCDESAATLIGARTEKPDTITIMALDSIRQDQNTEAATFWVKIDKHGIAGIGGENQWAIKSLPHGSLYGSFYQIVMDSTKFERGQNGEQKILTGPVGASPTDSVSDVTKQMIDTIKKNGDEAYLETAIEIENELHAGMLTEKEADALVATMVFAQSNKQREFFIMWQDDSGKVREIGWATHATADLLRGAFGDASKTKIAFGRPKSEDVRLFGRNGGPSAKHLVFMMQAKMLAPADHFILYSQTNKNWRGYRMNGEFVCYGATPFEVAMLLEERINELKNKPDVLAKIREDGKIIGVLDRANGAYQHSHAAPNAEDLRVAQERYGRKYDSDELQAFIAGYVEGLTKGTEKK